MRNEPTRKSHGRKFLQTTCIPASAGPASATNTAPIDANPAQLDGTDGIDTLLDDFDLERLTGCKRSTWQKKRLLGGNETPPFIRIGRLVRYRQSEFEAWLAAIPSRQSTSETV